MPQVGCAAPSPIAALRSCWSSRPSRRPAPDAGQTAPRRRHVRGAPGDAAADAASRFRPVLRQQAETDRAWRAASAGYMQMEKIIYRSRAGRSRHPGVRLPAAAARAGRRRTRRSSGCTRTSAAISTSTTFPTSARPPRAGYVVIAPEYRGSIGYGETLLRRDRLRRRRGGRCGERGGGAGRRGIRSVDPARIGIIGWSHGGLITLLSVFRNPGDVQGGGGDRAGDQSVSSAGAEGRRASSGAPSTRRTGSAARRAERPASTATGRRCFTSTSCGFRCWCTSRTTIEDVNIEEAMQLVDALRARKPALAEIKIYPESARRPPVRPPGEAGPGSRRTRRDQQDSWRDVWTFLDRTLSPPCPPRS